MTKREWQIEMANRFAKRDNVKELEAKLECYERLVDSINMASNPVSEKSRVALRNVREMKTIMTKEALAQPEQEPVAWMNDSTPSGIFARHMEGAKNFGCTIPLYTAPPQRTWVGLTRMELAKCGVLPFGMSYELCKAIEAKLKDKNT